MINPTTGLEDPNYKPKISSSVKPLNANIGGTPPTPTGLTQSLGANDQQVNGGPKLNLDKINEYRSALGAGAQLEHTATPQPTPASVSNVSGGLSNLKEVTTPTGLTGGTTGLTPKTDTTITPPVIDQASGKGATDTFGNQTGQLTPEELQVYNNMTPAEKQQMKADVDAKLATAANYVQTVKKQRDYMSGQEDIKKQVTDIQGKTQEIQSSERIRNAENQLNNLKQNIAYLGTQGKPGVSSVKLDAISRQLANANTTFQNLKAVEANQKELTRLGVKFDANQFEKQMTDLQDDLDNKVSKQVQNAMNEMTSAEMSGKLDTMEEISAFRTKLFSSLDNQISGVAEVNFTQRAAILKEYADMENKAMEVIQKSKTIDEKMSSAQGFYVDGNGKAVISKTTGLLIPIPKEAPIKPMYDEKTGRLVTFTTDANGKIVASMEDLIQDPTFTQETITNYASLVASGKLKIDDVPESVRTMSGFIDALQQAPSKVEQMTPYQQAQIDLEKQKIGTDTRKDRYIETKDGLFDIQTQKYISPAQVSKEIGKPVVTAGKTQNRPDRNNNPGNVKIGDVGYGVDNQNHTIFGDPTEGYNAMVKDLTAKLTGKSRWGLTPDSTLAQLGKIYAEDPKWSASVAKLSGYTAGTKLKDIDVNKLAPAVAKQEGFTGSIANPVAQELSKTDISRFNNPTFKPDTLKTTADKEKYALYKEKLNLFDDPNADFYDIISLSEGSGKGSVSEREKVGKYAQVLGGLDTLTGLVKSQETGPVAGRLKQLNPYSTDVAQFKAVIAGLVPSVARGIFNEVGVLTDSDVERYLGTLPTLEKTADQNKLVIAALLTTLRNGMKAQIDVMARSGVDVSKFEGNIKKMDSTISNLESGIGIKKEGDLTKPTPEQIAQATPKVLEDIKAGKSLEEMKQRAISKGTDPAFVEEIWNKNKQTTPMPSTTGRWQASQPATQGRWQSNQK